MIVSELPLPGLEFVSAKYPNFSKLDLSKAVSLCTELVLNPTRRQAIKREHAMRARFAEAMAGADFSGNRTIVQIGANDGVKDDPLINMLKNTTRAVLVEPLPVAFGALKKRYEGRSNTMLVNKALNPTGGNLELFVPLIPGNELKASVWASPSYDQTQHEAKKGLGQRAVAGGDIVSQVFLGLTAEELLSETATAPSDVAVLVCDTEGQDSRIVQSFMETGARPQVILYEQLHAPVSETKELNRALDAIGYELFPSVQNTLALAS